MNSCRQDDSYLQKPKPQGNHLKSDIITICGSVGLFTRIKHKTQALSFRSPHAWSLPVYVYGFGFIYSQFQVCVCKTYCCKEVCVLSWPAQRGDSPLNVSLFISATVNFLTPFEVWTCLAV